VKRELQAPFFILMPGATFKKEERLSRKKLIDALFMNGQRVQAFPVRIFWSYANELPFPAQVMFSVPKRKFKKATDRNRIKRQMREVYRNNKHLLYETLENTGKQIVFAVLYTGDKEPEFEQFSGKIILTLQRLSEEITRQFTEKQEA
jgi:ribonuclease P protein component